MITSTKTLFLNNITFWGTGGYDFNIWILRVDIIQLIALLNPTLNFSQWEISVCNFIVYTWFCSGLSFKNTQICTQKKTKKHKLFNYLFTSYLFQSKLAIIYNTRKQRQDVYNNKCGDMELAKIFGFFHKMLQKNPNECFGQPKTCCD